MTFMCFAIQQECSENTHVLITQECVITLLMEQQHVLVKVELI